MSKQRTVVTLALLGDGAGQRTDNCPNRAERARRGHCQP